MKKFFDNLFKKENEPPEEQAPDEAATTPLSEKELEDVSPDAVDKVDPPQFVVASARSVGMERDHNEDSLFTLNVAAAINKKSIPFGIYIIADGMGGHLNGEVASEAAVRAMSTHLVQKIYLPIFSTEAITPNESLNEIMQQAVEAAHKAVTEKAPGGGTTLTTIVILGNRMTLAHVGDSRAYAVYLDGRMQTLTRDHSLVKRLEELGQISAEEAEVHPQRNVLYRALGQGEPFEPDISTAPFPQNGYILLCSDGLWGLVPDEEMYEIISNSDSPQQACNELIKAANANGGPDNITAILVRMPD